MIFYFGQYRASRIWAKENNINPREIKLVQREEDILGYDYGSEHRLIYGHMLTRDQMNAYWEAKQRFKEVAE